MAEGYAYTDHVHQHSHIHYHQNLTEDSTFLLPDFQMWYSKWETEQQKHRREQVEAEAAAQAWCYVSMADHVQEKNY